MYTQTTGEGSQTSSSEAMSTGTLNMRTKQAMIGLIIMSGIVSMLGDRGQEDTLI